MILYFTLKMLQNVDCKATVERSQCWRSTVTAALIYVVFAWTNYMDGYDWSSKNDCLLLCSTELMRRVRRFQIAQYNCLVIKYAKDQRYSDTGMATHDK